MISHELSQRAPTIAGTPDLSTASQPVLPFAPVRTRDDYNSDDDEPSEIKPAASSHKVRPSTTGLLGPDERRTGPSADFELPARTDVDEEAKARRIRDYDAPVALGDEDSSILGKARALVKLNEGQSTLRRCLRQGR